MTARFTTAARRAALAAGTATILVACAGQAHAAAFYLQEQSVKATGRAFSGEVSEQGAQQMWWNPAAIGGISSAQSYFGLNAILPHANATNNGTLIARPGYAPLGVPASVAPVGGRQNAHDPVNNGYLPNGGFAMPLNEHWAIGLTATSPYSFTTNYAGDSWARYSADKTRLRTYDIQPALAFSTGGLSIGAGPNIEYSKATFSNALPDPLSPLRPDGEQALKGDGWNVGYSVGFQFHTDKVDMGISYKSAIKHKLGGDLSITGIAAPIGAAINTHVSNAKATFTTPWMVNAGLRYHITPQFTLEGQITRTGWEKFDAIELTNLGALGQQALPEDYHNTWSYAIGFDYAVTPRWTLRGGVQRDLSPVPTGERDPRVPDGNRWNFALGTSYKLNARITLDAAASYDKIKGNPIDKTTAAYVGTPLQTVILTSGELSNARALVFGLGGSMSF
ncbi:MAG TPA: outer membrane protein transport protein [Sphingomonas sp.]